MLLFKKKGDLARIYEGLSSSQVKQLEKTGVHEWFVQGSPIFRKGQTAKELYIIVDGAVQIVDDTVTPPKEIAVLHQGELFGELSLTAKAPTKRGAAVSLRRSASAISAQDTTVFVVEEEMFRDLLDRHAGTASKLLMNLFYITSERLREALHGKVLAEGISPPKLLKGLKDSEKRTLLKFSNVTRVPKGQPVFLEGEIGTELYSVLSGAVAIMKREGRQQKRLAVMGEGDIFGELGLATKKGRTASAVAMSDSELLVMDEKGLLKLGKKHPAIATKLLLNLFRIVTTRMRSLISPLM
jgi:CRP/FNR family transcriptional regulator